LSPAPLPVPVPVPASRRRSVGSVVVALALAALTLAPAFFWQGGVLEEETIVFMNHYLDDRSVAEKVFDPRGIDFDNYQARELSYLVDLLDAQVFDRLLKAGYVLFIPLSAIAATLLTWAVWAWGSAGTFGSVSAVTRSLLLLVLFTNYVFATTMGLFYRAAKPMVVPTLLGLLFYVWRRLGDPPTDSRSAACDMGVAFGLGTLMSAFDRQGFFYLIVIGGGLALFWLFYRRGVALFVGCVAAAALNVAYNYVVGPWLIHAINGYWPRFNVQRTPLRKLVDPQIYVKACELLPGYAATLFGGLPIWLFLIVAAGIGIAAWRFLRSAPNAGDEGRGTRLTVLLLVVFAVSQVFMFGVMVWRYPMVYDFTDHRLWYFPWPFQALLVFGLLVLLRRVFPRLPARQRALVDAALVLVAVANVAAWPRDRQISLHSQWFPKIHDQTARLKTSLRDGKTDPQIWGAFREFLYFAWDRSPLLASRIGTDVHEGGGFHRTELRDGQIFAWARQGAALELFAGEPGDYALRGELWLRPGETVTVARNEIAVGAVSRRGEDEGPESFALTLPSLPAGRTVLALGSNLAERDVDGVRYAKAAAFGIIAPQLERLNASANPPPRRESNRP
jgi:hypothetical protein